MPGRRRARGAITIEFALMFSLGMLPLVMLTFSGVMIFSAQQTLSLAAAEGARASLRHGSLAQRQAAACAAAEEAMEWLIAFSSQGARPAPDCGTGGGAAISVESFACAASDGGQPSAMPPRQCIRVTTRYYYDAHPFLPGTGRLFKAVMGRPISSSAVAQLDLGG